MEDETKKDATVPFHPNKRLRCTIKQFPTPVKKSSESLSLIPEQILQYGALDPIKDSVSKTLASKIRKNL